MVLQRMSLSVIMLFLLTPSYLFAAHPYPAACDMIFENIRSAERYVNELTRYNPMELRNIDYCNESDRTWAMCNGVDKAAYPAYHHLINAMTGMLDRDGQGRQCVLCGRNALKDVLVYVKAVDAANKFLGLKNFYLHQPALLYPNHWENYRDLPECTPASFTPENPAFFPSENDFAVWIHDSDRTCCAKNFGGVAPYRYHGTSVKGVQAGAKILRRFSNKNDMISWVCGRKLKKWAYSEVGVSGVIEGYDVTRLPCTVK